MSRPVPLKDASVESAWEAGRGVSAAAARVDLYVGHEVKQEMVVGPEVLQPPDCAFSIGEEATPPAIKIESTANIKIEPLTKDPEFVSIKQEPSRCDEEEFPRDEQLLTVKTDPEPEYILSDYGPLASEKFSKLSQYNVCNDAELETSKSNIVKKFSCDICHKQFKYKQSFNAHKLIHMGIKPHTCGTCKKKFLKKNDLERHERIHISEKPFSCEICSKQFAEASGLVRHRRTHTGQKPYSCGICKKIYPQAASLRRHKRSHTNETPYSCEFCEKQFADISNLKRHKRGHTGEKPYKCSICNKQFADASCIKRHERTHTGEKLYTCEICQKQFACKDYLKQHEQSHVKGKS